MTLHCSGNIRCVQGLIIGQGSKLGGAGSPAPSNSPAAPSNFCREPKNVLVSIHNICKWLLKMQLGSLGKILLSSPVGPMVVGLLRPIHVPFILAYFKEKVAHTHTCTEGTS